ncbi:MAG: histidinol-phosphatase HisJ family protein [Vallitaleaceae bacterium]|jgi:histidinol-phosphatase (PHP family)|nr:histidinol-phosphatase HisJ family protein [Vallitaleaceae bacterium]
MSKMINKFIVDYHVHSHFSSDSSASILDIAKVAVEKGISEIAITDHFEPINLKNLYKDYNPSILLLEIEEARERYKDKLIILHGVEYGQPHHFPEISKHILQSHDFDYILGSTHKNKDFLDVNKFDYVSGDIQTIVKHYFSEIKDMAVDNNFDCIGHLDLIRRYGAVKKVVISLENYIEDIVDIFDIIIKNGKGIEVNTSGLRQKMNSSMPDLDIVKLYHARGGKIITIGSDAHVASQVGSDIDAGLFMIKKAGFKTITTFQKREPHFITI